MSPEQIAGKKVDGQSDLYSLGVMLFQLLSGVLPFRAESMAELMFKIANEPAPDVRTFNPQLSAGLAQVVARAMAKSLAERYPTGAQMASELRALLREPSDVAPPVPPAQTPVPEFADTDAFEETVAMTQRLEPQEAVRTTHTLERRPNEL
jgi:serine/threonine-protein kinase